MELFSKLLSAIGVSSCASKKVDFITNLPVEIAHHLLRMLDARSLLNAAIVSRRWLAVCNGDFHLRLCARRHLRKQRRQLEQNSDTFRKSSKNCQPCVINVMQVRSSTRRTHGAQTNARTFQASTSDQTICTTDMHKTSLSVSQKVRPTRSIITLR